MDQLIVSKISRVRAWLLIISGVCLSVGMVMAAAFLALIITHNDRPAGRHWTGGHEITVKTFELFATVFVFGIVAAIGGVFQLRHGRPSWLAVLVLLGLVVVMFFLGQDIMRLGR